LIDAGRVGCSGVLGSSVWRWGTNGSSIDSGWSIYSSRLRWTQDQR